MSLDLKSIETKVWISNKEFSQDWELQAIEYREIIRILANNFSEWDCELTHSEYFITKKGEVHLVLCIDFFSDEKKNIYKNFANYIKKHLNIIEDLRWKFILSVWFNYWEAKGFTITKKQITSISHDEFMELPSDNSLPHRSKKWYKKLNNLLDSIHTNLHSILNSQN